jgi:tRNA dimethylallyltransferase
MIVVLGPTASGKTTLAAHLAKKIGGEIISADSRQVYCGMSIGTGKDLGEYTVEGTAVPYHLIDIAEPGYEYNVYEFLGGFARSFDEITGRKKTPVLCGGTGLYLDAVINGYHLPKMNEDPRLAEELRSKPKEELAAMVKETGKLHNTTDLLDRERMIRALLISRSAAGSGGSARIPQARTTILGIQTDRNILRQRITQRLENRLKSGMIEEVEKLLASGLTPDQLKFYGLEYRYITGYLERELSYEEMFRLLNTAIHQFSKRQMTWFRKMERNGTRIHWIDGTLNIEEKVRLAMQVIFET